MPNLKAYLQAILFNFLDWINRTKLWEDFFKALGKYNIRFRGYPLFQMSDYFKIVDILKQNKYYVFVTTDSKSVSSILIKEAVKISSDTAYFSHAGHIFYGGERNTKLLHMRDVGLIEQLAIDYLKQVDYFCVIELPIKNENKAEVERRITEIKKNIKNIVYDWEQDLTNGDSIIYCSELIYKNFKGLVDSPNFKPRMMFGRLVFDPDILLGCGKIVYSNHPKFPVV